MAFNSYRFILLFLPLALALYYTVGLSRLHRLRLPVLIALTLAFYARAAADQLPLLIGSILFNYGCARLIVAARGTPRRLALAGGVAANVLLLLFFKYSGFLVESANMVAGTALPVPAILLPLAISFYTFQQIAFLVDASRGLVTPDRPLSYAGSILFFPFIISGPITFFREIGPQLDRRPVAREVWGDILVGSVLFTIGLAKKTVLADSFALWVDPLFDHAASGHAIGVAGAWGAAAAYLLQIYYDFSGYSDMALGVARMLGILLPLNFFSPIRCTSIIDYWRRWHITLGRFVNVYIFQPLAVPLARWGATRGYGRNAMLAIGTLLPTFLTMVIIGAWHGGRWTFFLFGAMHGAYMVVNEAWKFARRKRRKGKPVTWRQTVPGNLLTMLAVIVAIVAFRAPDLATAGRLWGDMLGGHGLATPPGGWPVLHPAGGWGLLLALVPGFALAYLMPNAQQLRAGGAPALEWTTWRDQSPPLVRLRWRPTVGWALVTGALLLLGFAFIGRGSGSFVYFGF